MGTHLRFAGLKNASTTLSRTNSSNSSRSLRIPSQFEWQSMSCGSLNKCLAGGLAAYLLRRALWGRRFDERMVEALIIAGLGTGARQIWISAIPIFLSRPRIAERVLLSAADDADSRNKNFCEELTEEEIGDLYLLLCRLFPHSEDPEERSGFVTARRALVYFRNGVLEALSGRSTLAACTQLRRLAAALPAQDAWLLYRSQQTLSAVRRNEWQPSTMPEISAILTNDRRRIVRDNGDLMNLVLESLEALQRHLKETTLPAVEDLWHWEGAGLQRKNFRHKDEEAVSDYIARWLRDHIGPQSGVVVNREVQPVRGKRTDIIVEAWSHSLGGGNRHETPLSVTIEVKGCWNTQIKTGAVEQLLEGYLRPFRRTHGVFLVAWFHSPASVKIAANQPSELKHETIHKAMTAVAGFVQPAQVMGFEIVRFVLDCRLE